MGWYLVAVLFAVGYVLTLWVIRRAGREDD
jgi:hypothetical protein